jgi:hypothetical protein
MDNVMTNKQIAKEIRLIAKSIEETGSFPTKEGDVTQFSCIMLSWLKYKNPSIDRDLRKEYESIFSHLNNTNGVWVYSGLRELLGYNAWVNMSNNKRQQVVKDQRITMLCFFAAMIEKGDI